MEDKTVHGNPVEIIKKDIYLIRNKVNGKGYVGQSINYQERFRSHCKPSSAKDGSLIDMAIQKYGPDNFSVELLESQVDNYNERERFWIKKCGTLAPHGYNIEEGGNVPPSKSGFDHPNSAIKNSEHLRNIKDLLITTRLSLMEIARREGVSKKTVMRINHGKTYAEKGETFPLRKEPNQSNILSNLQADKIIYIIKTTYKQYGDIAKEFGISLSLVKAINEGRAYHRDGEKYPLRKYKNSGKVLLSVEDCKEVHRLLRETDLSLRNIAKQFGVSHQLIMLINSGKSARYRFENEKYPLRKPF